MELKYEINSFDVDVVFYWVDGNNKDWQKKYNKYAKDKINFQNIKESIRYNSVNEISYAIYSVIENAPFIRNIFLVTDNQKPLSFEKLKQLAGEKGIGLILIDHKIIFRGFEQYLPCFNSTSIETLLYRIPNLAEHFIIFNDDLFLMRKTKKEDFFNNGYPVLRGSWRSFYEDQLFRREFYRLLTFFGLKNIKHSQGFKKYQQNSAKIVGEKKYFRRFHTPMAIRKSTLESFFKQNKFLLENNIKYRIRHSSQFLLPTLADHLEIKNKSYVNKKTQLLYFGSYKKNFLIKLKLKFFKKNNKILFVCFQNLEQAENNISNYIFNWIKEILKISDL